MKKAKLVTVGVAVAAGLGAMYFMTGQKPPPSALVQAIPVAAPEIATDDVLVASRDLGMGTLITEQDLVWAAWPKAATSVAMIKKSELPKAVEDIKGSVTRGSFFQGEPIRREKVVKGPNSGFMSAILSSGMRAVAINIDASGSTTAGGFILPNDHVDIIRTRRDEEVAKSGGGDGYVSEVLLPNVRILAIGQNVQEKNGERVVVGSNATLEVDPRQAEMLILAQRTGQLSMTLRSMLDTAKNEVVAEVEKPETGMTIVRAGIVSSAGKK
jgi:pilus assembly protein CpaB